MLVHKLMLEGMATQVGCRSSANADQSAKYAPASTRQAFCRHVIKAKNKIFLFFDEEAIFAVNQRPQRRY
jgi:hypothetical protein